MEALQRTVADEAVFTDQLPFEPTALNPIADRPVGERGTTQSTLTDGPLDVPGDDGPGDDAPDDDARTDDAADRHDAPIVAGVDQAFLDDTAISAIVAIRDGTVIERTHAVTELSVPYIPGLLSFREGEAIVDAFATLECEPDLVCFDGSGRIHYRQAGLATHMGVVFDLPAIGIAKNLLCGEPREPVDGRPEGWRTPIEATDAVECPPSTTIGYAYQSRQYASSNRHINPLYVSPGHRVAADTAVDLVAALCGGYKLPEPTRLADAYADERKAEL